MNEIPKTLRHTRETYLYSLAFTFERSAFYGIRGLIVLYMINHLQVTEMKAFNLYGLFGTGVLLTMILGGLLGDLITGNRRVLIIGAVLQIIGSIILCFNSMISLYLALGFFIIGSGFYSSNIRAIFGKLYLNKIQLIDSGFTIFQTAVSIGALFGTTIIVELGMIRFIYGFILAGFLLALSAGLCFYIKEKLTFIDKIKIQIEAFNTKKRLVYILSAISIYTVFRILYEVSTQAWVDFQYILKDFIEVPSSVFIVALPSISTILVAIILCILWKKYYLDHFIKISVGFVFVGLTFLLKFMYPDNLSSDSLSLLLLSILFITFAELIIWPSINSAITKYTNPRYLATMFGIVAIPSFLISGLATGLFYMGDEDSSFKIILGLSVSLIIVFTLIFFRKKYKNNYLQHTI